MSQQDLNIMKAIEKIKVQEQMLLELNVKFVCSNLKISFTQTELSRMKAIDSRPFVPLEQRIVRYLEDVESEVLEDPLEIAD